MVVIEIFFARVCACVRNARVTRANISSLPPLKGEVVRGKYSTFR